MQSKIFVMRLIAAVTLAMTWAISADIALAGNLSGLEDTPMTAFNEDDRALMMQTVTAVLDDATTPAKRSWQNPQTKSSGSVETLVQFSGPKGESCKRVRVTNQAGSRTGKANYTLCNMDAEGWKLVPSDYAPMPKSATK